MLAKLWDELMEYLKEARYWKALRPFVLLLAMFVAAQVLTLQYLQWQHGVTLPWWLFLRSYYFRRILLVFVVALLAALAWRFSPATPVVARWRRLRRLVQVHRQSVLYRGTVCAVAVAILTGGWLWLSPRQVTSIKIMYLDEPANVRSDALAYLVYELNRRQRIWFYEIDLDPLNPESLKASEQTACADSDRPFLCYAEKWSAGRPVIALTEQSLGETYFGEHRGHVSVLSTADHESYAPLSDYEFLLYNIIVQSVVIHLDLHGALPEESYRHGTSSRGGVFQYTPEKAALKATILAASFSPAEEELILNEFGPEYLRNARELLSMEWLYAPAITADLAQFFEVSLSRRSRLDAKH